MAERELPWDWKPPSATPQARAMWDKPWWQRARDALSPTDETFALYFVSLVESFTVEELRAAIARRRDVVEMFIVVGKLRHKLVRPMARLVIQRNSQVAYQWLVGWSTHMDSTGPRGMLNKLRSFDAFKADMLSTPEGWSWWQDSIFELALMFREFGQLDKPPYSWPVIPAPPGYRPIHSEDPSLKR